MLPVILTATFMALFDFFVINVAAPSLEQRLHASPSALQLVLGGYAFSYASCLVTGGRLGDLFGYKRMFLSGMTAFTVASALCGLAMTPGELIAARLLQGITTAMMVPQVLALITVVFPASERSRALSWFGVVLGVGAVAGQLLGGVLLNANLFGLGWRIIFLVNVPVGMIAVVLAARQVPAAHSHRRPRLDPVGAAGFSAAIGLILVPLVLGRSDGWPPWTWVCLACGAGLVALAVGWERRLAGRGGDPVVDLSLFRNRFFCIGLGINIAFLSFFASFMLGVTILLQDGLALTPLKAGLTFGPLGMAFGLFSVLARRVAEWVGPRVITYGLAIASAGLGILLLDLYWSGAATSAARIIGPLTVIGAGSGLAFPALVGAVLARTGPALAGSAAGILTTVQQFAIAAGVAVLGGVFFAVLGSAPVRARFVFALGVLTAVDCALTVGAVVLSVILSGRPDEPAPLVPTPVTLDTRASAS